MLRPTHLPKPRLRVCTPPLPRRCLLRRTFARLHDPSTPLAFTPSIPHHHNPLGSYPPSPPDERTIKLGRTLRILQPRLPTLLASPLPQEILSPSISLHLFPSTHPHLPTVSGRVAYHAALWTSPITWGKIPLVGNVHLEVLSERMIKASSHAAAFNQEKLVVKWRTTNKTLHRGTGGFYKGISATTPVDKITAWLGGDEKRDDREFCGKFIFEFDDEGRILEHIIERVEEAGEDGWENGMGRVVGLGDWLLGRLGGKDGVPQTGLAIIEERRRGVHRR